MKKSTIIIGSITVLVGGLGLFFYQKKKEVEKIINKLEFELSSIKNIKLSFRAISLDLGIKAINPTSQDLLVNTLLVKASVLRVYEKTTGKMLAVTNIDKNAIDLPAGGSMNLPLIHIDIPLLTGAQFLLDELSKNKDTEKFIKKLSFELDLKALGQTKTITF